MSIQNTMTHRSSVGELLNHSQSELNDLFFNLPAPKFGELNGCYKGSLMAISGLNWFPRIIRIFLYRLLKTYLNPWNGKRFDGDAGANYWFTQSGNYCFGRYSIEDNKKGDDGLPLTLLSYDVVENTGALRPIRGEVRKLNDDLFLARMHYKTRKKMLRIMYFTLERNSGWSE